MIMVIMIVVILKCLVLSQTQRYSVYGHRGEMKAGNIQELISLHERIVSDDSPQSYRVLGACIVVRYCQIPRESCIK